MLHRLDTVHVETIVGALLLEQEVSVRARLAVDSKVFSDGIGCYVTSLAAPELGEARLQEAIGPSVDRLRTRLLKADKVSLHNGAISPFFPLRPTGRRE